MYRVLMVDDDPEILRVNRQYFEKLDYEVLCADSAARALQLIGSAALDCVVLDVDMPGEDGFALCERVRKYSGLPIVFLSGYTEEHSRIRGLRVGGDDYVCKPYSLEELELRVCARIRAGRAAQLPASLTYGKLVIDASGRTVRYGEQSVEFSTYEFDILYFLARYPGQVFSYEQIFEEIWQSPINKGLHTLQVLIARVRQKLDLLCPQHEFIQTIRRKGYLFVPEKSSGSDKKTQ